MLDIILAFGVLLLAGFNLAQAREIDRLRGALNRLTDPRDAADGTHGLEVRR